LLRYLKKIFYNSVAELRVKTKRQVPPENWQVLYGQYKENLRLCFLPVNEETNQGYWFGFESEIQKPEPVFKAMN
jgi:hypothetical protein